MKENHAFNELKQNLMTKLLLILLDFNKPFEVHFNACGDSIEVFLSQEGRPIAYESHRLHPQE
ncbi:RNase H-like domain-containing protein [Enterobacter cloacae complex sp. GF14B]|uniref:RNase H-like domain-containing protein n=1 Tax=Enterobacter cloacae complex sp. GF14B TaxID=2511982 RepID=UPI00159EE75F